MARAMAMLMSDIRCPAPMVIRDMVSRGVARTGSAWLARGAAVGVGDAGAGAADGAAGGTGGAAAHPTDEASKASRQLTLRGPQGQVKRMFAVTRFETLFAIES